LAADRSLEPGAAQIFFCHDNVCLVRSAFQNQQAEASQSYVALVGDDVVGFYTLVVAQVEYWAKRTAETRGPHVSRVTSEPRSPGHVTQF
jgi:hypothetical protein